MRGSWARWLGPARPGILLRPAPPRPAPWGSAVESIGGHPGLRLGGSPEARGRRHGEALRPQIDHLLRHYLDPLVGRGERRSRFLETARRLEEGLTGAERAELRGLIEGSAETGPERLLLGQTFLDSHRIVACSTVIVRERRTGRLLFGRNLDFPSFGVAHRLGLVLVHQPDDGIPFAVVGWPGLLGVISGLNRAGLAVALNLVYGERDSPTGTPLAFAVQRVLREACDLSDADRILRGIRFASSNNLTLADARGGAAVFEVGPERFLRRDLGAGTLCATNHFVSCRRAPRLAPMSISSHLRLAILRLGGARGAGRDGPGAVRRALARVAVPKLTLQSMVFDPRAADLHLSMGRVPAARGTFVHLDRKSLWGAG